MPLNKDADRIARALRRITPTVKAAIAPAVDAGGNELVVKARLAAPVDDGTLRASIRKEAGPKELSVTVRAGGETTTRPVREGASAEFDYALGQEYGTAETASQPFFWPTVRSSAKRIRRRIDRAASKAIKAEWSRT